MIISIRYDMRSPDFGASPEELHAACLEQCAWADQLGFVDYVWLSEHHRSDDGYMPSPLVIAAAIAARTERVRIRVCALLLPLHDPVRIAEDAAVVDLISRGRLELVVAGGYVPSEFAMFGKSRKHRAEDLMDGVEVIKRAWAGEHFEFKGRDVFVTPRPYARPRPPLYLGGSSAAAARRAAGRGDGFYAMPEFGDVYLEECDRLGVDPGFVNPTRDDHILLHVTEDPDRDWARIAPHALHEAHSYADWARQGEAVIAAASDASADGLRTSGRYLVMTPEECVSFARGRDPEGGSLRFHPLIAGLDPELGWASLRLFAERVLPTLRAEGLVAPAASRSA